MDDDGFIKEKIDTLKKAESSCDVSVPDSLYQKCSLAFTNRATKTTVYKRKFLIPVFSSCVVAVVVLFILLCNFLMPNEYIFQEKNIRRYPATHEEFYNIKNILHLNVDGETTYTINKDINKQIPVYCTLTTKTPNSDIELNVVLAKNYTFYQMDFYDKLSCSYSNSLFECKYFVYNYNDLALATFEYKNYNYYLMFNSPTPENIVDILDSFSL